MNGLIGLIILFLLMNAGILAASVTIRIRSGKKIFLLWAIPGVIIASANFILVSMISRVVSDSVPLVWLSTIGLQYIVGQAIYDARFGQQHWFDGSIQKPRWRLFFWFVVFLIPILLNIVDEYLWVPIAGYGVLVFVADEIKPFTIKRFAFWMVATIALNLSSRHNMYYIPEIILITIFADLFAHGRVTKIFLGQRASPWIMIPLLGLVFSMFVIGHEQSYFDLGINILILTIILINMVKQNKFIVIPCGVLLFMLLIILNLEIYTNDLAMLTLRRFGISPYLDETIVQLVALLIHIIVFLLVLERRFGLSRVFVDIINGVVVGGTISILLLYPLSYTMAVLFLPQPLPSLMRSSHHLELVALAIILLPVLLIVSGIAANLKLIGRPLWIHVTHTAFTGLLIGLIVLIFVGGWGIWFWNIQSGLSIVAQANSNIIASLNGYSRRISEAETLIPLVDLVPTYLQLSTSIILLPPSILVAGLLSVYIFLPKTELQSSELEPSALIIPKLSIVILPTLTVVSTFWTNITGGLIDYLQAIRSVGYIVLWNNPIFLSAMMIPKVVIIVVFAMYMLNWLSKCRDNGDTLAHPLIAAIQISTLLTIAAACFNLLFLTDSEFATNWIFLLVDLVLIGWCWQIFTVSMQLQPDNHATITNRGWIDAALLSVIIHILALIHVVVFLAIFVFSLFTGINNSSVEETLIALFETSTTLFSVVIYDLFMQYVVLPAFIVVGFLRFSFPYWIVYKYWNLVPPTWRIRAVRTFWLLCGLVVLGLLLFGEFYYYRGESLLIFGVLALGLLSMPKKWIEYVPHRLVFFTGIVFVAALAYLAQMNLRDRWLLHAVFIVLLVGIWLYRQLFLYVPATQQATRALWAIPIFAALITANFGFRQASFSRIESGLSQFDGEHWSHYSILNSPLSRSEHYEILQMFDDSLWFVDEDNQIHSWNSGQWQEISIAEDVTVRDIVFAQDSVGQIWYAIGSQSTGYLEETEADGISSFNLKSVNFCNESSHQIDRFCKQLGELSSQTLMSIYPVDHNSLWYSYNQSAFRINLHEDSVVAGEFYGEFVVNDVVSSATTAWLATEHGLIRHDLRTDQLWKAINNPIQAVYLDESGLLWFITEGDLYHFDKSQPHFQVSLGNDDAETALVVNALERTSDGTFWVATDHGVYRVNSGDRTVSLLTSSNSDLPANVVEDMIATAQDTVWFSVYQDVPVTIPQWVFIAISSVGVAILLIVIEIDYRNAPIANVKRLAGDLLQNAPEQLYQNVLSFFSKRPASARVQLVGHELAKKRHGWLDQLLRSFDALIRRDNVNENFEQLVALMNNIPEQRHRLYVYRLLQTMSLAQYLPDILRMELTVIERGQSVFGVQSANSLAIQIEDDEVAIWQALATATEYLNKYAEVDESSDRLSYLAAALGDIQEASIQADSVVYPNDVIYDIVINRWREIISDVIDELSGSADIRIELRTHQIRRANHVTVLVKVSNIGQSAGENVRVELDSIDGIELMTENPVIVERISPSRSELVEFMLNPQSTQLARLKFHAIWDDRVAEGRETHFTDEVTFYTAVGEFKPIDNPYIVGHPVKDQRMFFGREDVFHFIEDNLSGLHQDRTVILYGQRRTGKTSILYQLVSGRLNPYFIPVIVDMQALIMLVENTGDFIGEILYRFEQAMQDADVEIEAPVIDGNTLLPTRVFDRFLDELAQKMSLHRLLIIFDEFELIEQLISEGKLSPNILGYFRSTIQHRDNLTFIFSGTHRLEEMSQDYWSTLFNIALNQKITFLSESDAEALIRKPVEDSLTIDDLTVEKIIRLTSGHPYFTQLLCWALVNYCNEQRRNYATINDVNDAVKRMLITGTSHFSYIWQQALAIEQLVLATLAHVIGTRKWAYVDELVARLQSRGSTDITPEQVIKTLDRLVSQEILEVATEGRLGYRFRLEVLRLWITQNQSITMVLERIQISSDDA